MPSTGRRTSEEVHGHLGAHTLGQGTPDPTCHWGWPGPQSGSLGRGRQFGSPGPQALRGRPQGRRCPCPAASGARSSQFLPQPQSASLPPGPRALAPVPSTLLPRPLPALGTWSLRPLLSALTSPASPLASPHPGVQCREFCRSRPFRAWSPLWGGPNPQCPPPSGAVTSVTACASAQSASGCGAGRGAGRGGEPQTQKEHLAVTPRGAEATHPSSLGPRPSQTRPAPLWPISLQAQGPSSLPGPQRHCPPSPSVRSGPVLSAGRCPCVRSASFQTVGPHRGSRAAPRTAELGAQALSIPSPWALCRSPPAGLSSRVRAGHCPCPRLLSGCVHLA